MKYKAIVFDMGDTLLTHYPSQSQLYTTRLKSLGLDIIGKDEENLAAALSKAANQQILKEQNGAPRMADEAFEAMLDAAALRCVLSEEQTSAYLNRLAQVLLPQQTLKPIPGAAEALHALKAKGFHLGIVSNHRPWLRDLLDAFGWSPLFDAIVISDIVGVEKPHVRIMQIALDAMALDAASCLYVGDHPFDVLCAKNAGMDCAWLTAPDSALSDSVPYEEDYRIQKLEDLLALF